MNVLITGGAGFLGTNLCRKLLEQGTRVIALDNFITSRERNTKEFLGHANYRFIKHDIIDDIHIDEDLDQIYNLACPASPPLYQKNPIRTVKANTIGTINVLGLARVKGARVFQASTSEIYGDPLQHPQPESYRGNVNTVGVRSCYDEGKRISETLMFDYHRQHGVDIRVVRIFNTYGPFMDPNDGRVVSNFIMQALQGKDLTIYGDGTQTRSFCYVDDLIDGFLKLMEGVHTGPVNLGNPGEFTVRQLAEKVIQLTGSHSKIVYQALPADDPVKRRPDITLARKELNWEPRIDLHIGLEKTIAYFKKLIAE